METVDHFAAVRGRVFLLLLDDLLHDDIEGAMAFDGVLTPESASYAGQAAISRPLTCQNTPERLLHRFPSQGPQVPPPVGKPEWRFAQWSPFGRGQPFRRNGLVKTWARPPTGLSSMPTEQRPKRPPPLGLGAESGDETRGVGTTGSVR